MASKRAYIMLTIGLTCLGALSAQDMDKSEADTVKIETDTAWHFDSSFGEQLAIPLKVMPKRYYGKVGAISQRPNQNLLR
jgi:hypothetical protein